MDSGSRKRFDDGHVKPLSYTAGYIEPYSDRNYDIHKQFPTAQINAPFVRALKEHEPQDLNFD